MALKIEVVVGEDGGRHAAGILQLWAAHGALDGEAARRRLGEVVCVLQDDGVVHGVNSAVATDVALVGGRRLWFYRRFLPQDVAVEWDAPMLVAAFEALEKRSERDAGPIGLCTAVDRMTERAHPAAVWPASQLVFAGRMSDGRSLRVRYFERARIA